MPDSPPPAARPAEKPPADIMLDLRGLKCPLPALRTQKALARAQSGAMLVVICTDPMARIDIPHLLNQTGDHLIAIDGHADETTFRIMKA